jgi:hypothetical protein
MSAADTPENPKLFPEPTSAMRFFHQHYDKISPKSQREEEELSSSSSSWTRFRQTKLHDTNTQSLNEVDDSALFRPLIFHQQNQKQRRKKGHKKKESERVAGDPLTFLATVKSWKASKSIITFFRSPDQIHRISAWSVQRSESCCRLIERGR